jgi:protein TonB
MEANKILQSDFLDILFDGRNKEYGAYDLRRTYTKRALIGLAVMVSICLLVLVGIALANKNKKGEVLIEKTEVVLEAPPPVEEPKPEEPPPPPPPEMKPPEPMKLEVSKFTPPKIVEDEKVKPEDEIKEVKEIEKTTIGTFNQEGAKSAEIQAPPVEVKGTGGTVIAPKAEATEDYSGVFTSVQIEAKFPGGLEAWKKYLERNLNQDEPTNNGAPPGRYTVVVSFIVDKEGNLSEVRSENDPGYGTATEAVRVIKKGPKWTPAVQNGRNVIYRQRQSITFVVNEG